MLNLGLLKTKGKIHVLLVLYQQVRHLHPFWAKLPYGYIHFMRPPWHVSGSEGPRNNTLSHGTPSLPPPPPRFTTPLPEGLLSVGIVTDEEQMELFIMHNYTPTDKQLPWDKTTERNVDRKSPSCHGLVCFIEGGLSTIFTFILPLKLQVFHSLFLVLQATNDRLDVKFSPPSSPAP